MYVNKCNKCGSEFETKNPKRVICPNCLYPDKKMLLSSDLSPDESIEKKEQPDFQQEQQQNPTQPSEGPQKFYNSYSVDAPQSRPYNRPDNRGGYDQPRRDYNQGGGGYNRPQQGGYNRPQGDYNRPQQGGGYNRPPQQGGYNRPQ